MAEALAVKYRPQTLETIIGQDSVSNILKRQAETNTFKNCYLFCGPSGCGKTTTARAFSRLLNGTLNGIIEIDAASNNGVDAMRNIVSLATERAIGAEYKVFIVDECHVLSNQAWQALLKTLEEPHKYTIFMLCTTNPEKIPATILNRVQRFNLQRISRDKIKARLIYICEQEHYTNYESACDYISKISNGQMRDAITYLDKCATYSTDLNMNNVMFCLGDYSYDTLFNLVNSIVDRNESEILKIVNDFYYDGKDLKLFISSLLDFVLDINKYCLFHSFDIIQLPPTVEDKLNYCCNFDNAAQYYNYYVNKLADLKIRIKDDISPKSTIEVGLLQMSRML